ncbi:MAG TPA: YfhO family protein, partial [Thermomicrobiales bacterium]|nr:YfhO family protein [Thermomicrobiales bacterium]
VTWDQVGAWIRTDRIELGIACLVLVLLGLLAKWPAVRWSCAIGLILLVLWDPALDRVESRHASPGNTAKLGRFVSQSQNPGGAVTWLLEQQQSDPYFRYFGYDVMQLMNNGRARTYHITYSDPKTIRLVAMNRSVYFGLNDIQGYNPVQIKRYVEFMNTLNAAEQSYHAANVLEGGLDSPLLNILGVRYIVVPAEVPPERPDLLHLSQRYKTVYQDASVRILENPAALPRAWMVHDVKQVEDADRLLTRLALHLDDPTETVLLQDSPPTLEPAVAGAAEQVTITSYSADEIRLTVNASSTGMVVLSEIWDPGWSATVDGQDAEVWAADYALRGIVVGPGTHEVVLRYDATIVKRSLLAWFVPLFALVGLCIPWPDRRRRTWAEAEPTEADIWA